MQTSRTLLNVLRCPGQPLPSRALPVRPVSVVGIENPRPSGIWKAKSNREALAFSSNFRLGQGRVHARNPSFPGTHTELTSPGPALPPPCDPQVPRGFRSARRRRCGRSPPPSRAGLARADGHACAATAPSGKKCAGRLGGGSGSLRWAEPSKPLLPSSGIHERTLILGLGGLASGPSSHTGRPPNLSAPFTLLGLPRLGAGTG